MVLLRILPLIALTGFVAACVKTATDAAAPQTSSKDRPLSNLAGSEWSIDVNADEFVQFRSNGELMGQAACNSFHGTYELDGQKLIIGPIASTRKLCPPEVMAKEKQFLGALGQVDYIEATHFKLTLFDADHQVLMTLQRRDWD